MFNWITFNKEEYVGIKKLLLTTPIRKENLLCNISNGIFGYWEVNFSLKLDKIEKLDCITASNFIDLMNRVQLYVNIQLFKTYKIELEDIVKRIDFEDKI